MKTQQGESSNDIANGSPPTDKQDARTYQKYGITYGITYRLKILMWVMWKLWSRSDAGVSNWFLGTNVCGARGFHDLVLKYEIDNTANRTGSTTTTTTTTRTKRMYRFVKIMHSTNENSRITFSSLKSGRKKKPIKYSLSYLFESYLNIVDKFEDIKSDQIVDITFFTNVNIHQEVMPVLVRAKRDKIFDVGGRGERYRVNPKMLLNDPEIISSLRNIRGNDGYIRDFLRKLVFAVGQPSESELEDLVASEMGKNYSDLYKSITEWCLTYTKGDVPQSGEGEEPYLTEDCLRSYLDDAKKRETDHVSGNARYLYLLSVYRDSLREPTFV